MVVVLVEVIEVVVVVVVVVVFGVVHVHVLGFFIVEDGLGVVVDDVKNRYSKLPSGNLGFPVTATGFNTLGFGLGTSFFCGEETEDQSYSLS